MLLDLSIKKYKEVISARALLSQELDVDWQNLDSYSQQSFEVLGSILEDTMDETIVTQRMYETEERARQTNEELENVLGERILSEAIQDKHEIGNIFQRLLRRLKKNEREER